MAPRGGARAGAGRPKGEETKVMRIPIGKIRDVMEIIEGESYDIPMFSSKVQAGVPEMADDVGIHSDDTLIVDRSITPRNGHIVIAALDGALTVKRLSIESDGRVFLLPENQQFSPIPVTEESDFHIWGVVTNSIRNLS